MEQELRITTQKVLQAEKTCPTAKAALEALFPEAFKEPDFPISTHNTTTNRVKYLDFPSKLGADISTEKGVILIIGRYGAPDRFWLSSYWDGLRILSWKIEGDGIKNAFELIPIFERKEK